MNLERICERHVVSVDEGCDVVSAARVLQEHNVTELVVTRQWRGRARPVGVLSERDIVILAVAQAPEHLQTLRVADLIGNPRLTARLEEGVNAVVERMSAVGVRRIPVVDAEGELVGVVGLEGLLEQIIADRRRQQRAEALGYVIPRPNRRSGASGVRRSVEW